MLSRPFQKTVSIMGSLIVTLAIPAGAMALWTPWKLPAERLGTDGAEGQSWMSLETVTLVPGGRGVGVTGEPRSSREPTKVDRDPPYLNMSHGWEYTAKRTQWGIFNSLEQVRPAMSPSSIP